MAFTATNIRPLPGAIVRRFDAGGTIYCGEACYVVSDGDVERADSDAGSLQAHAIGIVAATNDGGTVATDGDRVDVVMFGPITGYSSLTPGLAQFVSTTAGALVQTTPAAGSYVTEIGVAINASTIFVNLNYATPYVVKA